MELKAEEISQIIKEQISDYDKKVELSETGVVLSVGDGIARVYGLEKAMASLDTGEGLSVLLQLCQKLNISLKEGDQ